MSALQIWGIFAAWDFTERSVADVRKFNPIMGVAYDIWIGNICFYVKILR